MPGEFARFQFDTVAIIGVGLIGGSIGKALLRRKLAKRIIGVGRDPQRLAKAQKLGAITCAAADLSEGVASADLVIVGTPVDHVADTVRQVASNCSRGVLITDVGSTKAKILSRVGSEATQGAHLFVGSHPLAGGEKAGVEFSDADLFENRMVIVTPVPHSDPARVEACQRLWTSIGASVRQMSPEDHDALVAVTSHVPHLLAAMLASTTTPAHLPMVSSGWLDTTRIASGDVEMWSQIIDHNRDEILASLQRLRSTFDDCVNGLQQRDFGIIRKILQEGKANRDAVAN
jgi:prephenate dehydrogenase